MAIIHDLTEAEIGDIPFSTAYLNPEIKNKKKDLEKVEIKKIKKLLDPLLKNEFDELFLEMEERKTFESKLVKALDCMETNYQALLFGDIDWWEDIYYDLALYKSKKHCTHKNILQELNDEINKQTEFKMKKIGLDVEKIKNNECNC